MRYLATWTILIIMIVVALASLFMGFYAGLAFLPLVVLGFIGVITFMVEFCRSMKR